jgi:hypothetical protein
LENFYRRMLGPVLAALRFRCHNTTYRPVMDAIGLLARYAQADGGAEKTQRKAGGTAFAAGERVPIEGVVPKEWQDAIERIPYELGVLVALREALWRREMGRREMGRREMGRREMGRREMGRREMGRREMGGGRGRVARPRGRHARTSRTTGTCTTPR